MSDHSTPSAWGGRCRALHQCGVLQRWGHVACAACCTAGTRARWSSPPPSARHPLCPPPACPAVGHGGATELSTSPSLLRDSMDHRCVCGYTRELTRPTAAAGGMLVCHSATGGGSSQRPCAARPPLAAPLLHPSPSPSPNLLQPDDWQRAVVAAAVCQQAGPVAQPQEAVKQQGLSTQRQRRRRLRYATRPNVGGGHSSPKARCTPACAPPLISCFPHRRFAAWFIACNDERCAVHMLRARPVGPIGPAARFSC